MAENDKNGIDEAKKQASAYARFTTLGFQMIAVIGIFAFAGYKIDEAAAHQTKWVTALLALIGVFVSLYLVIRSVKN